MRRLRLLLAILVVLVLVGTGALYALGRTLNVGPFAPGAPRSWVYVAISRNGADGDAREIEVIDLAAGDRQLFSLGDRAFDVALSSDRRTLFVGTTNGRVWELDAIHGAFLEEIKLGTSGDVRRLVVVPDGRRIVAVSSSGPNSTASLIDLAARHETAQLDLGNRVVGRSTATAAGMVLAVADRAAVEQLIAVSFDPWSAEATPTLSSSPITTLRTAAPALVRAADGTIVALSPFSLRLYALPADLSSRREAAIPYPPTSDGRRPPILFPGFDGDLELANGGALVHLCVGAGQFGARYVADVATLTARPVGSDCGVFATVPAAGLYLAVRGKPDLEELDATSGAVKRTLPLAGYGQRVAY